MSVSTATPVSPRVSVILRRAITTLKARGWTPDYRRGTGGGALSTTGVIRFLLEPLRNPRRDKLLGEVMLVLAVELRHRGCQIQATTPERIVQEWSEGNGCSRSIVIELFDKCANDLESGEAMKRLTAQMVATLRGAQRKLSSLNEKRTYEVLTKIADNIEATTDPMPPLEGAIARITRLSQGLVSVEERSTINALHRAIQQSLPVAKVYARG